MQPTSGGPSTAPPVDEMVGRDPFPAVPKDPARRTMRLENCTSTTHETRLDYARTRAFVPVAFDPIVAPESAFHAILLVIALDCGRASLGGDSIEPYWEVRVVLPVRPRNETWSPPLGVDYFLIETIVSRATDFSNWTAHPVVEGVWTVRPFGAPATGVLELEVSTSRGRLTFTYDDSNDVGTPRTVPHKYWTGEEGFAAYSSVFRYVVARTRGVGTVEMEDGMVASREPGFTKHQAFVQRQREVSSTSTIDERVEQA